MELHLQFGALERMLADQVFTQEGRRYVHGNQNAKCNFAYLEKPRMEGDAGRLAIHARFTGRSAMNSSGSAWGWAMRSTSPSWRRLSSATETSG